METYTASVPAPESLRPAGKHNRAAQRPDHFAGPRRWASIALVAAVAAGYLLPVGYLTAQALLADSPFPGTDPWLIVLLYLVALPLLACALIAGGNVRITDRRRSWRRLALATVCFILGFVPLLMFFST
jgi:hypothetical protein